MRHSFRRPRRSHVVLVAALAGVVWAVPFGLATSSAQTPTSVQWVSASASAPGSSSRFADATCPAGAAAVGGGFSLEPRYGALTTGSAQTRRAGAMLTISGPVPGTTNAWRASGYTNGSEPWTVAAHTACVRRATSGVQAANRISSIEYVVKSTAAGLKGGETAVAACPAGTFAIGGAVAVAPSNTFYATRRLLVTQSMPETSSKGSAPNSWRGTVREAGIFDGPSAHQPWSMAVTAVCAALGPPPAKTNGIVSDITTVQSSSSQRITPSALTGASCQGGQKAIGAAAWVASASSAVRVRISSIELQGRTVIAHAATESDPQPAWSVTAQVTCASL